jgi:hypothetical protein
MAALIKPYFKLNQHLRHQPEIVLPEYLRWI